METTGISKKNIAEIIVVILCLLGAVGVAVKMLFTGFSADEEYQLVMAYRLVNGDGVFAQSWDTIQTSGFLCGILIKLFVAITGSTTGVLVYLRACGIILQALVALFLYKTISHRIGKLQAVFTGIVYFAFFTKLIALPEFSNMQSWFLTMMICLLWRAADYYEQGNIYKRNIYLVLSAVFYSLSVLSTLCIILVPVIIIFICVLFKRTGKDGLTANLWFFGTCVIMGIAYVVYLVAGPCGSLSGLIDGMKNVLLGDSTHATSVNIVGNSKWLTYGINLIETGIYLLCTAILAYAISYILKRVKSGKIVKVFSFENLWGILGLLVTSFKWVILQEGYDTLKLFIPVLVIVGIVKIHRGGLNKDKMICLMGICLGVGAFINVLFISNVPLINNLCFLFISALFGLITVCLGNEGKPESSLALLVPLVLTIILGSGYTLSSGPLGTNIFELDGIIRNGPAKDVIVSKDVAWIYRNDYIDFENLVPKNSNVLIITDYYRNTSVTSCYLLNDVRISHYSVNSTPTYSERLEDYWELYPDKKPDVIMVNTNAVKLIEGSWCYNYINEKFGYTESVTTENAVFYFR